MSCSDFTLTPVLPQCSPNWCWCRYNELQQRWVALDTWTLSLWFQAPPHLLRHRAVLLRCDGLDTGALQGMLHIWP